MSMFYLLDKNKITYEVSCMEWGRWLEENDNHVKDWTIRGVRISTVFLGIDMNHGFGKSRLFETMIFCDDPEQDCTSWRTATWKEACQQHRDVTREVIQRLRDFETCK